MKKDHSFRISIEPNEGVAAGRSFLAPNVERDFASAKRAAEKHFRLRNRMAERHPSFSVDSSGHIWATRTVAILQGGVVVDIFDGVQWESEREAASWDDDESPYPPNSDRERFGSDF